MPPQQQTRIGRMRERVKLQAATEPQDDAGQPIPAWADVATVYAAVESAGGGEVYSAEQVKARRVYLVSVRAPLAVTEGKRFVWLTRGNLVLNVSLVDDADPFWLHCTCVCDPIQGP